MQREKSGVKAISLLSQNDLKALERALHGGRIVEMEREWAPGGYRVWVRTVEADLFWADIGAGALLLQVEEQQRGMRTSQYYISVEDMKEHWTWTIDRPN